MKRDHLPLVYSCSGCSSAAQTANVIAIKMDRADIAEMSCIAGVGGDVKPLVRTAMSGREIIAIDGCKLACSKHILARHNLTPEHYFTLSDFHVPKKQRVDPDLELTEQVYGQIIEKISAYKN